MRAHKRLVFWHVALLLAVGSFNLQAQQSKPAPAATMPVRVHQSSLHWNELSAQRRAALSPLQSDWDKIDEDRQKKMAGDCR